MATRLLSSFMVLLSIGICAGEGLGGGAWRSEMPEDMHIALPEPRPSPHRDDDGAWGPGMFAEEPQDTVVRKNADAVLACSPSSAYASWTVSWRKDGVPLLPDTEHFVLDASGSLAIRQVSRSSRDVGEYRCALHGPQGVVLSKSAILQVASLSHDVHGPENITVPIGGTARLFCGVDSVPAAKITWKKDDKPLPINSRYVTLASGVLLISLVDSTDEGVFKCVASNNILKKSRVSNEAFLKLGSPSEQVPIHFLSQNKVIRVSQGETVSVECSVSSHDVPVWSSKGKDLWLHESTTNLTIPGLSILTFQNIQESHAGTYNCTVKTAMQFFYQTLDIEVFTPPTIMEPLKSESHPTAHTVRFSCDVRGVPFPNVTWYKDGTKVKADWRIKLTNKEILISLSAASDTGFYQCMVQNGFGEVWSVAHLYINSSGLQLIPLNVMCQKHGENFVTVHWTAPAQKIVAYTVHYWPTGNRLKFEEKFTQTNYCNITDLKPFTNYTFSVRSYTNKASEPSQELTCKTKGSVPDSAPEVILNIISPTRLNVSWVPLDPEESRGNISEYKIQWRQLTQSSAKSKDVSSEVLQYTITDLVPGSKYEIRVLARTTRGWPKPSVEAKFEWSLVEMPTKSSDTLVTSSNEEPVLEPPYGLEAVATSPHSINLTWSASHFEEVEYFSVVVKKALSLSSLSEESDTLNCTKLWVEVFDLQPNTLYELTLKTYNKYGYSSPFSEKIDCRTFQDAPEMVTDVSWNSPSSSNLKIMWKQPNGSIIHFNVSLVPLDGSSPTISSLVNGSLTSTEVSGVKLSVPYQLIVAGISGGGVGPPSRSQLVFLSPPKAIDQTLASESHDIPVLVTIVVMGMLLVLTTVGWLILWLKNRLSLYSSCSATRTAQACQADSGPSQRPFQPNGNWAHGQVPLTLFVTSDSSHLRHQLGLRGSDTKVHDGCDSKGLEDSNITLLPSGTAPTPIGANSTHQHVEAMISNGTTKQPGWSGNLLPRHLFNITENPQCDSTIVCKSQSVRCNLESSEQGNIGEMEKLLSAKPRTYSESETEDCGDEVEGDFVGDMSNVTQVTEVDHSFQDKSNNNDIHNSSVSTNGSHSGSEDHRSSRSSSFLGDTSESSNDITEQQLLVTFSSVPLRHLTSKHFMDVPKVSVVGPNG